MRLTLLLLLLSAACGKATAQDAPLPAGYEPLQRFPVATVTVTTSQGEYDFQAWIARTPRHRAQGLMFVRTLDAARGMLFVFPAPVAASFWMQNTYIPLDMLFVHATGRITNIAASTRPLTTDAYTSSEPVVAVLELAGGTAARLGIRPGDRVHLPPGSRRQAR